MRIGVSFPTTEIADPSAIRNYVQAVEGLGFDYITLIDHVLQAKTALADPDVAERLPKLAQDVAQFMLVRGPYAWLGLGFVSCHPGTNYSLPDAELGRDYGVPLENCTAVPGRPGVFSRRYSKARVEVDCGALV